VDRAGCCIRQSLVNKPPAHNFSHHRTEVTGICISNALWNETWLPQRRTSLRHYGSPPHRLLDGLATASGFSWETCAQILFNQRLISTSIDLHDLAATRDARSFWNQYGQGRACYFNLIMLGQVREFEGDWAYFEDTQLESLLPGIIVPSRLKREHYLANYVMESDCSSLDVYAGSNLDPLFQHRFLQEFNPLFFGEPRSERRLCR
jgi:hypothetical protein